MHDNAQEIFEYLPIRRNKIEDEYITHLWDAFSALDSISTTGKQFSIMPFHLLFMLALQYKILRIANEITSDYQMALTLHRGRDSDSLITPSSVFEIASLHERSIPDLLKLVEFGEGYIKRIKILVDNRNENLAHANGGIEGDLETKIEEYINLLKYLQNHFLELNNKVGNQWKSELSVDDDIGEFIEYRLLNSTLCPADFKSGKLLTEFAGTLK